MYFSYCKCMMICLISLSILTIRAANAIEWVERSRDQFGKDFAYFIYPIAGDIPGMGTATGGGVTILNINDSDLDFSGFYLEGDFDVAGYTLLNHHIIKNRLLFDIGYFEFDVARTQYDRGIDSDPKSFILPKALGDSIQAQLTWSFHQRQVEAFLQVEVGERRISEVLDQDGNAFESVDKSLRSSRRAKLGVRFDNTSDRLHPRAGYRLEFLLKQDDNTDPLVSDFLVTDYNATFYIPMPTRNTLAFNLFRSDAYVTKEVKADYNQLQQERGLGCSVGQTECEQAEARRINQMLAANQYGTATSLGGTQRLRSFSNGRYYASHSMFYGVEYRMNLNDERKPFNWFIAKGIRTGLQLAFFAEQGSVAERSNELFDILKTSYGVGFRLILTGVIIRFDYSNGSEGDEFILFIDYPWGLLSVDS